MIHISKKNAKKPDQKKKTNLITKLVHCLKTTLINKKIIPYLNV